MPSTVRCYYNRMYDAIVVATTTMTYTLLHLGRINNLAKVPPVLAPADLLEFLRPPFPNWNTSLSQNLSPYRITSLYRSYGLCLWTFHPQSPQFLRCQYQLQRSVRWTLILQQRSLVRCQAHLSQTLSEETFTAASRVYQHSPARAHGFSPCWIRTPIIPQGCGRKGCKY